MSAEKTTSEYLPQIERRGIEFIPLDERHGRPSSLFTLWFSANMQITAVVTGIVAIALGLNLLWALLAILIGNALGGIFMAYHSAQGPKMGLPQMIQSRAQFGSIGSILPILLVIFMYIGFFAASGVLGGQAIAALLHINTSLAIVICDVLALIIAIVGYDLVHSYERIVAYAFAVIFIILTVRLLMNGFGHPAAASFSIGTVVLAIAIFASWQLTYGPYVADYSRYLPENTSTSVTFWYTYLGSVIGSVWMMWVGALAAVVAMNAISANTAAYLSSLFGSSFAWVVLIIVVLGILAANVLNLYGGFLSIVTGITTFVPIPLSGRALRPIFATLVCIIGTIIAVLGQGNFLTNYSNFLLLLLYFIIPWSAINLVDFYLVKRSHYSIPDILERSGGIYGVINWKTVGIYILTILLMIPFINTTVYEGPIAKMLGDADIAWLVGLIVSGVLYYLFADKKAANVVEAVVPAPATEAARKEGE